MYPGCGSRAGVHQVAWARVLHHGYTRSHSATTTRVSGVLRVPGVTRGAQGRPGAWVAARARTTLPSLV